MKPLKRNASGAVLLLKNVSGGQTADKKEQGAAVTEYLVIKGSCEMKSFHQHLDSLRTRDGCQVPNVLYPKAVVGAVDGSCRVAKAPTGKATGP